MNVWKDSLPVEFRRRLTTEICPRKSLRFVYLTTKFAGLVTWGREELSSTTGQIIDEIHQKRPIFLYLCCKEMFQLAMKKSGEYFEK
jgi:hypothetical protein